MGSKTGVESAQSNVATGFVSAPSRVFCQVQTIRLEQEIKLMLNIDGQHQDGANSNYFRSFDKQSAPGGTGQSSEQNADAVFVWTNRILKFLGRFNRSDLLARDSFRNDANRIGPLKGNGRLARLSQRVHLHRLDRSNWFKQWVAPLWWPIVVRVIWTTCAVHLLLSLGLMYQHDRYKFRLHRVRWLNSTHPDQFYLYGLETEQQLRMDIVNSGQLLQLVWSTEMHISFLTQNFILCFLIMSTINVPLARFYYTLKRPLNFDYLVELLDYSRATRNCRKVVRDQTRLFIKSSCNFTRALVEFSEKSIGCRIVQLNLDDDKENVGDNRERPLANRVPSPSRDELIATVVRKQHSVQVLAQPIVKSQLTGCQKDERQEQAKSQQTERVPSGFERQLRRMLLHNQLTPMNHSPEWQRRLCLLLLRFILIAILYALQAAFLSYDVLLQMQIQLAANENNNNHSDETPVQLADSQLILWWSTKLVWLLYAELFAMILITSVAHLSHMLNIAMSCIDQILLARNLLELIKKLVHLNTLRFYGSHQAQLTHIHQTKIGGHVFSERPHGFDEKQLQLASENISQNQNDQVSRERKQLEPSVQVLEEKMSSDLLLVIMHYRIFLARQLDLIRHLGVLTLWIVTIMFMFPFIGRLHQPYLMGLSTMQQLLKVFLLYVVMPGNVCLLLICYMHRRCLDLYVALNSIVAHATEISSSLEGRNIYDRHQVSMLRKELSHHEGIVSRLATKFAGISMTYPNLVRIHLYLGFLVLSLMSEDKSSEEELSVSIFTDPFRLF